MHIIICNIVVMIALAASACDCLAYVDLDKLYTINFPKGWEVSRRLSKSGDKITQAIHPNSFGSVAVKTFKDYGDKSAYLTDDFANRVLMRRMTPDCQLYASSPITYNGMTGAEHSIQCNGYYQTDIVFVSGNDIFVVIGSFIDDNSIGMTVKDIVSSFRILKKAKSKVKR